LRSVTVGWVFNRSGPRTCSSTFVFAFIVKRFRVFVRRFITVVAAVTLFQDKTSSASKLKKVKVSTCS
ncbi:hypothetical protein, partial [Vibrio breoganii]|uniref:hypothetical protein n=1 Tax=Vibrio breoganii TaxID=553239 RepID=UPI0039A51C6D